MRLVLEEWIISRWWTLALPLAAVSVAAYITGDLRLWVLVPVLICLLFPLLLVVLYYTYAVTPEAVAAVTPHLTRLGEDGSLTLIPEPATTAQGRPLPVLHIPADRIETIEEHGDRTIVSLSGKPFRFVIIPTPHNQENENV